LLAAVATALVLVTCYLLRDKLLPSAARFLDVSEAPQAVDYILVLGGGSETRPFAAAALYHAGLAKKILVPTIHPSLEVEAGMSVPEHELICNSLMCSGVPGTAIVVLPGDATNTSDEARLLVDYLRANREGVVGVVTNGLHSRRAHWIFRRALGREFARVHFFAAPSDGYNESNWWRFERGWADYATEFGKLSTYWLRE
jgi:uncharacterized SAM-binding protein YcdF (DUF218 family)